MATYRDIPVSGRQIRVLDLAPGASTDELVGVLIAVPLDYANDYEAISYVWGSNVFTKRISLPSGPLAITASLDKALRGFRHSDRKRRVWADSICINQGDSEEKGRQVAMMADIYRLARQVLIWVGDSDEATLRDGRPAAPVLALWTAKFLSDFAIENGFPCTGTASIEPQRVEKMWDAFVETAIRSTTTSGDSNSASSTTTQQDCNSPNSSIIRRLLCCHTKDTGPVVAMTQSNSAARRNARRLHRLCRNNLEGQFKLQCPCECKLLATISTTPRGLAKLAFGSLGELLRRPYFGRMWVLQEAVFARDAIFHYGCHRILLQHLYYAVDVLKLALGWLQLGPAQLDPAIVQRAGKFFNVVGGRRRAQTISVALGTILEDARSLEHSEPRDRVYGLLSMIDQDTIGRFSVQPDYNVPLGRLWARVAVTILTSRPLDGNFPSHALCFAGLSGRQRPLSRPSWAPDFNYLSTEGATAWERKSAFLRSGPTMIAENILTGNFIRYEIDGPSASGDSKLDISRYNDHDEHWHQLILVDIVVARVQSLLPNSQFPQHPLERPGNSMLPPEDVATYAEHRLFPWYIGCMRFMFRDKQASYDESKSVMGGFMRHYGVIPSVPPGDTPPADAAAFDKYVLAIRAAADRAVAASMVGAPARLCVDAWRMVIDLIFFLGRMPASWNLDLDRILAFTDDGRIAWVPSACEPGDLVTLFAGVPVPIIVRPAGRHGSAHAFELVGDAYVLGLMKGEAWPGDVSELRLMLLV